MRKPIPLLAAALVLLPVATFAEDPVVHIQPPNLQGSPPLEAQTGTAVVRDYLQSWKAMQTALDSNSVAALDPDFIGAARDKLVATIEDQSRGGIHTHYTDKSHDLQIIFYSPEGLSIQMTDDVQYEEQVILKDKTLATKTIHQHYLVVMTPSETRWQVRIFQTNPS